MDWRQGRVLDTPRTREFSPEYRADAEWLERCGIYEGFREEDLGRSRRLVAECQTPTQAAEILAAISALEEENAQLKNKIAAMQKVIEGGMTGNVEQFCEGVNDALAGIEYKGVR